MQSYLTKKNLQTKLGQNFWTILLRIKAPSYFISSLRSDCIFSFQPLTLLKRIREASTKVQGRKHIESEETAKWARWTDLSRLQKKIHHQSQFCREQNHWVFFRSIVHRCCHRLLRVDMSNLRPESDNGFLFSCALTSVLTLETSEASGQINSST